MDRVSVKNLEKFISPPLTIRELKRNTDQSIYFFLPPFPLMKD
jgi:hypothetical protein